MKNFQKICILLSGISVVTATSVPSASAISSKAKPSQPRVTSVSTIQGTSKNKVDVIVNFTKASTSSKSPLLFTEVRVGSYSCSAKKSATKCTVKNVPTGKVFAISARAKNRMGFGKSSPKFSLNVFVGARWTSSPSLGGTAPSLGGGAPISSYTPFVSNVDPAADVTPATTLQFDLSGAVGLALKSSVSSASVRKSALGSNLVVVLESGLTREALSVGTASINKFIIAPNNRLYVLFNSATNFGSSTCLLAQVNRATGKAVCLESQNLSVDLTTKNSIQFDSSGNIYYAGTRNWAKVLRRFSNGVAVDYINQYQSFDKWLVLPNGDVILGGSTAANGLSWTRRISVTGAVTPVAASSARWLMFFPDGNAYFESDGCIKRYLTSGQLLDPTPWSGCLSGAYNREGVYAMFLNSFWITANAQVLAQYTNTSLYYLYPTIKKANQPLQRITYGIQALTSMVLVGINATGTNQMVLFDSTNNSSSLLADGSNEIEFYRVQLNLAQNRVYFDGLRFADNKYVIGYLDLSNRTILSSDVLTRVQDFQTFVG